MKYDFDTVYDRRNTGSVKWDVKENELPMWVADMDFKAAPEILEAMEKRVQHGIFGYTDIPDEWYDAYVSWWETRHGFRMEKEGLIFCTGVIAALSSIVRKLTTPNENVLIQTPVYNIFVNSTVNNGCRVLESPLVYDPDAVAYAVDFDDLEKKLADPQTSLMILCNPHNPIGKIWDRETLARVGELCEKHHVTVVSDEIHCDVATPGKGYVPFASVNETCRRISVTLLSPAKAFNLASVHSAAVYVSDPFLRHKVWRGLNTDEVAEPNAFACDAAAAAYLKSGDWLDELNAYVAENKKTVSDFLKAKLPDVKLVSGDATYLLWMDVSAYGKCPSLATELRAKTGLFVNSGHVYGGNGENFIRMNVGCPRRIVLDGMRRLEEGLKSLR